MTTAKIKVLDSHVHFFDPLRISRSPWPPKDGDLYQPHWPADLLAATRSAELLACIAVETSRLPEDDGWLLRLSESSSLIDGVVLNLQPDEPDFADRLSAYMASEVFVGVRFRPIEMYDLSSPCLLASIGLLERAGKTIEFGAKTVSLKRRFFELAQAFPGTTWVLDHCAHPPSSEIERAVWEEDVCAIASLPNTACKVTSGYSNLTKWSYALNTLLAEFGPGRLMYGSNWPVCCLADDMNDSVLQFADLMGEHSEAFFRDNARRIYKTL